MQPNKLISVLQELGLSEKESETYLSLLSQGETTVLNIARASGVKRTTIYPILESLKEKGLVSIVVRGFKHLYKAESPEKLKSTFEQRKENLMSALPDFLSLYGAGDKGGVIRYYEGLEAVKNVYEANLRDIKSHEKYLVISNQEQWMQVDPIYFEKFINKRARLPIDIRILLPDSLIAREHKKQEKNHNQEIRFLPEGVGFSTNIVITPQRLFFHKLTAPISGIVIENESAIRTQVELFDVLWKVLEDK